jgi:hypothetical protein
MKCCICGNEIDKQKTPDGKVFWDRGHNAMPIKEGRCCSKCNNEVVVPVRIRGRNLKW